VHYGYELRTMLVAATDWTAWRSLRSEPDRVPPYGIDLAQDSTFLHARNLYDLLVVEHARKGERRALGLSKAVKRTLYTAAFEKAVHEKLFHVSPDRPFTPTGVPADKIIDQVLDIARDALDRWDALRAKVTDAVFGEALDAARTFAITAASEAAQRHEMPEPLFS
jgi:hypothetical protein